MSALTTVVIVRDEAERIGECLASVAGLGDVVVVDTGSVDGTPERAREAGARVERIPWRGFVDARLSGLAAATTPWVLMLDADERVDARLRDEIARVTAAAEGPFLGYRMRRLTRFLGREMRHGAWGRDRPLRLFRRAAARYAPRAVHEHAEVDGPVGFLEGTIVHLGDATWSAYLAKMNRYTSLQAEDDVRAGRRGAVLRMIARPPLVFVRDYVVRGGFVDGWPGFALAAGSAFSQGLRWAKVWEAALPADEADP